MSADLTRRDFLRLAAALPGAVAIPGAIAADSVPAPRATWKLEPFGYRAAAGLPAPGKPLGGWAARNSDIVFGQWLSGMARAITAALGLSP